MQTTQWLQQKALQGEIPEKKQKIQKKQKGQNVFFLMNRKHESDPRMMGQKTSILGWTRQQNLMMEDPGSLSITIHPSKMPDI